MTDPFKCFNGECVDLDDPKMYHRPKWKECDTTMKLYYWAWSELGKSLYYMQFFNPDVDWGEQKERVHGFCRWFAEENRKHFEDTEENRIWFRKFIYKFLDEVENQC